MKVSSNYKPQSSFKSLKFKAGQFPLKNGQKPVHPQSSTATFVLIPKDLNIKSCKKVLKSLKKYPVYKYFKKMK